jgi:hypothetical protein
MNAVLFAGGKFVGGFTDMHTSNDGITWTKTDTVIGGVNGIAYGAGTFLAVCNGGYIHSSSDGMSWTQRESPTFQKLWDVAYGNDTFVAVGFNGTILQSGQLASSPPVIEWISPEATIAVEGDAGNTTSFYALSVTAKGRGPFAYQWFKDDKAIPGGDDFLLRLPTDRENGGRYHVVVTNAFGSATSDPVEFVEIIPEFRMEIEHHVMDGQLRIDLKINAPLDQFYALYVRTPSDSPDWQYLGGIYVDQPDYIYWDYPFEYQTTRIYQLRTDP